MAAQGKINVYMERHRIGPLFEDLMNKVLRDMPEEPMVYLLRAMYKKAGMEIPQGIRYGGLRKSTSELNRISSPERPSRSAAISSSADVAASRDYERPWATSPTRRTKPKKSEEPTSTKRRPEWNADKKIKSSFDDLWENTEPGKKEKTAPVRSSTVKKSLTKQSVQNAWASVGLGEDGDDYSSPVYHGARSSSRNSRLSEQELLAAERVALSKRSGVDITPSSATVVSASRPSNIRKMEAVKHRERLAQLLSDADQRSNDSGIDVDLSYHNDDDAIEMLENADDLKREGVRNIPKSGYKLSRHLRYRENEPKVKLNINVNPLSYNYTAWQEAADRFDTPDTERSSPDQREWEEEDFESVSQVTGPRQPVWKLPDTDVLTGDSPALRPSYSRENPQRSDVQQRNYKDKWQYSTTPGRYIDRSVESTEDLINPPKSWTAGGNRVSFDDDNAAPPSDRSLRSGSSTGGWLVPEDTEVASAHDWNQRVKGGPPRDPRAY